MLVPVVAMLVSLPASSGAQTLSDNSSVLFSGVPGVTTSGTVGMRSHSASFVLSKEGYAMESLTVLRNGGDKPATVEVMFPIIGHNPTWTMVDRHRVSALAGESALVLREDQSVTTEPDGRQRQNRVAAAKYTKHRRATLTFKPKQTISVRFRMTAPLGTAGLDGLQRVIAYDTVGAGQWSGGATGQLNCSIKYTPDLVFQIFAALPSGQWQTSSRGAANRSVHRVCGGLGDDGAA